MALRLRRGTNAERATRVFDLAEPVWVTDKNQLWIGTGTGSVDPIQSYAGTGLSYSYNSTNGGRLSVSLSGLNTDSLTEGTNNKYFSNTLAETAVAQMISNGTQDGIVFTYDPVEHSLSATVDTSAFLVSADTAPTLAGDLSLNNFDIKGAGKIKLGTGSNIATIANSGTNLVLGTAASPSSVIIYGEPFDEVPTITAYSAMNLPGSSGTVLQLATVRNTLEAPQVLQVGDSFASLRFLGRAQNIGDPTPSEKILAGVAARMTQAGNGITQQPRAELLLTVSNGNAIGAVASMSLEKGFQSKIFRAEPFATATARNSAIATPLAGMVVFVEDDESSGGSPAVPKLQVYNGTAWVDLN